MPEYLKLSEVARRLDVSEKTARRYVKSGEIPSAFFGGAYRVADEDLEKFLEGAKVVPGKVTAPPSQRSLFNGLEEERRLLDYRKCREALDRFCDYWEQALDEDRLDRRACDEFNTGAKLTSKLLVELWRAEKVELRVQRGEDPQTVDKSEPWPPGLMEKSELWPAIDRWMVIGLRVNKIAKEQFGEDAAGTAVADLREYASRRAG